jgi:hypothetical protein
MASGMLIGAAELASVDLTVCSAAHDAGDEVEVPASRPDGVS